MYDFAINEIKSNLDTEDNVPENFDSLISFNFNYVSHGINNAKRKYVEHGARTAKFGRSPWPEIPDMR